MKKSLGREPSATRHGSACPKTEKVAMGQHNCGSCFKIEDVCRDECEVLAIGIGRFIVAGYMTGDVACWDAGYDRAEQALGAIEGSRVVAAMACVVRALRAERVKDWHFMPASCGRLTADEVALVRLLALARVGKVEAVPHAAAELTGSAEAPKLTAAVLASAPVLNKLQGNAPRPDRLAADAPLKDLTFH